MADSRIIRNISRLYLKQTDAMSTNAMEFRHHEYAAKLVRKMKGGTKVSLFIRISRKVESFFIRVVYYFRDRYFLTSDTIDLD